MPDPSPAPAVKVCTQCGKPCISMCPVCLALVHSYYGYNNESCGLKHEAVCPEAKKLREYRAPSPPCDTSTEAPVPIVLVKAPKNGAHAGNGKKARK